MPVGVAEVVRLLAAKKDRNTSFAVRLKATDARPRRRALDATSPRPSTAGPTAAAVVIPAGHMVAASSLLQTPSVADAAKPPSLAVSRAANRLPDTRPRLETCRPARLFSRPIRQPRRTAVAVAASFVGVPAAAAVVVLVADVAAKGTALFALRPFRPSVWLAPNRPRHVLPPSAPLRQTFPYIGLLAEVIGHKDAA